MARRFNDFGDLCARSPVTFAVVGLNPRQRLRDAWVSACRTFRNWLSWLAFVLVIATGSGAFAQTQQMNTVTSGVGTPYSVTSDGKGNIYFPYLGYIYYLPPGTASVTPVSVSGSGGLYPFTDPIVAIKSDVSGDLFVAVQHPINTTNAPYVQVYELLQGSSGYTWGGLVSSPSGSTPPPLVGGTYSTLNSMAYDNLNAFLYLNYITGPEGQQVITCSPILIAFTGNTTAGSTTITSVSSTSGLIAGQLINSYGASIPVPDYIASVGPGSTITLTVAATTTTTDSGMDILPSVGCDSINQFTAPLNDSFGNGLAVDGAGNVYTAYGTSSGYVAQFSPGFSGPGKTYSTAGTGFSGGAVFPGTAGLVGLAADDAGQIFIDAGAEIYIYAPSFNGSGTPTGFFTPVAGTGVNGYNGDNGTATLLQLNYSQGIALDPNGALWIADTSNGRIREITPAGIGQGEGTGSVTGASPTFGCLQCGPQSLGNGTGGVAGYGNQPAPTDTIQTNQFSNVTLLDPGTHKLYVRYPYALVVFSTINDTVQTTGSVVDIIPQQLTQLALDPVRNVIWAINSVGQVVAINSATDQLIGSPITVATGAQAQAIAVDSKLNQVYAAYYVASGFTYHVAVIAGPTGTVTTTLPLNGPAQALVADSAHGVAYLVAQDPYTSCTYCAQYNYDMVVINGTNANGGRPIEITSTTTLIEGSAYSSGITNSSLAVDPNTGKVVLADAVDNYFTLYNPAVPSYEAVDHVSLGWIPNAVSIDTANSLAYITDSQYNNVQVIGLATVLSNTAFGFSTNLFSGTPGGNNCGFLSNAVVPDPTTGEVYITTCTVNTTARTATPVLNMLQYTGVTVNGTTLTPTFTCGYGSATCPPLDSYNLPTYSSQNYGFYNYEYFLNVDTSDHAVFAANAAGLNILVFNGPYPPAARPQQTLNNTTFAFNNAGLGMPQMQTLTFTNNGTASMLDPVITFAGTNAADFSYTDGCTAGVPASGGTCSDTVKFTPSVLGSESATALVVDNSPDLPQTLTLSGAGVLPTGSGTTPSSTLLQVSALQVAPGAALTLYATISPAISSSGEQVLFLDNNTTPATVLGTGTALGGSVWTLSTTTLAAGTHALTAYYAGDATYAPSTSSVVNVVISSSGTGPSQPLLSFTPGSFYVSNPQTGTDNFSDVALDSAGDEFVLDSGVGSVTEYPVGGSETTYVDAGVDDQGSLMNHPSGVAVAPGGGTVYITDTQNNHIATATLPNSTYVSPMEIYGLGACNGGTPTSFAVLSSPTGISIGPPSSTSNIPNSAGYDLYVADSGNKRVLEINPVGGNTSACGYYPGGVVVAILAGTGSTSGPALNSPLSVAASSTNVFIADAPPAITNTSQGSGTIYKNGTAIASTGQIVFPYSVATDAAGDLYFSDQSLSQVWRIDTQGNFLAVAGDGLNNAGSSCTSAAPCEATQTSVVTPYGLAISGNGSIYVGDAVATGQVGEVNVTTGMLTFPGQPTSTTSSPLTVTVTDTASMAVGASGASLAGTNMADFAILTGVSGGTCNTTTGFTLSPGHSCTILITFTPGATGTRTAVINLTTQSDIYGGTVQQIQLTGNGAAPGLLPQTIAFPPPPRPVVYGAGADALSATASSSLSVSYSVSGPGVLSGNSVRFTGVGLVKIVASQAGNGGYAAATSVEQDIAVLQAPLIVTTPPATRVYEAQDPVFPASITGFIAPDTQASIVTGSPTFTVASGDYGDAPVGTILTVNTGLGNLALSSSNYAFSLVPSTLTVVCCESQSFVPASLPPANFPIPVGATYYLTVSATSGLPVSYAVLSGPGTTATTALGPTLTATGTGTITVQLSQTGNTNISAATPITLTFLGH
jgi:sugar lactone lactonase YvrE